MSKEKIHTICGMCSVRCAAEAWREDGRVLRLSGNSQAGGIKGAMCPRGAAGIGLLEDDERPQHPMIRTGERGAGQWRQATWDEALDFVANKLADIKAKHGAKSVICSDRGGPFTDLHRAFIKGFGSPNMLSHDPSCASNVNHAAVSLFGAGRASLSLDLRNAKHIVLQTRNIFEAVNVKEVNDILDAQEDGCKITVIDIRGTITACKADNFFMIRPGTDYAFNLAVIHELLTANLYDAGFAQRSIADLDKLFSFVAPYTPEWAEEETGVPAASIRKLARQLAQAAPSVIWHPGWMTSRYEDSFQVSRTSYIINALLGAYGAKGGLAAANGAGDVGRKGLKSFAALFPKVEEPRADAIDTVNTHIAPGGGLAHKAYEAMTTGDPYPVKGYIAWRHDPIKAYPDPPAMKRHFANLDLLVSVTFSWSETAWFSDVVLPLSTYLERESPIGGKSGLVPQFYIRNKVVEPRFDTRSEREIIGGLAKRLGLDPLVFDTAEAMWEYQLGETGVSLEDFKAKGFVPLASSALYREPKYKTPSGKIELVNALWEKNGVASLAPYVSPARPGDGQFRITFGRTVLHTQGHTVNNPYLHEQMPENVLWINTAKAKELGVRDGDLVELQAANGGAPAARIRAKVTKFIHPEAVFMVHGFGHQLPVESRARGRGTADVDHMPGGLDLWSRAGGGVNMQEHFLVVRKAG